MTDDILKQFGLTDDMLDDYSSERSSFSNDYEDDLARDAYSRFDDDGTE